MNEITKNLIIPNSIYYADPFSAVRSILGNDVEILELNISDLVLFNDKVIVNVKYKMLDFDAFKLYKVEKTKLLKQLSDRYIIDEIIDTITNEKINIKIIVDFNITDSPKYVYLKYYNSPYPDLTIYGKEVTKNDVFHSWCSIFDSLYLSYHGTSIKHILNEDKQFKTLTKKEIELNEKEELNAYNEMTAYKNNNFNNACYDIDYLKGETEILNLSNLTPKDLKKMINTTGILILSEFRKCPFCLIKIKNEESIITESTIENLIIVLEYDGYNFNLLN